MTEEKTEEEEEIKNYKIVYQNDDILFAVRAHDEEE